MSEIENDPDRQTAERLTRLADDTTEEFYRALVAARLSASPDLTRLREECEAFAEITKDIEADWPDSVNVLIRVDTRGAFGEWTIAGSDWAKLRSALASSPVATPCPACEGLRQDIERLQESHKGKIDLLRETLEASNSPYQTVYSAATSAIERAKRAEAALIAGPDKILRCAFCGHEYPDGTPATKHQALNHHVVQCLEHPLWKKMHDYLVEECKLWDADPDFGDHVNPLLCLASRVALKQMEAQDALAACRRECDGLRVERDQLKRERTEILRVAGHLMGDMLDAQNGYEVPDGYPSSKFEAMVLEAAKLPQGDEFAVLSAKFDALEAERDRLAGELEAERDALKEALQLARTDIGHWIQLGTYQREMMDQNLGWCPTAAGIEASRGVLAKMTEAFRAEQSGSPATPPIDPERVKADEGSNA